MIRRVLLVVGLGLIGLFAAASIGYASYLVSRDSVGLPVTKLEPAPEEVAPPQTRPNRQESTTRARTATVEDRQTTGEDRSGSGTGETETEPDDDNSGRGRGRGGDDDSSSGSGSGSSGSGSSGSGGNSGSGSDDFDD